METETYFYEVQTYDNSNKTVYYEVVDDAIDYEDARDVIASKYPQRKVIGVARRKLYKTNKT